MASDEPSIDEIRSVFRLVNACCEKWDHPDEWQAVLLDGMKRLCGLDAVVLQLARPTVELDRPILVPVAWDGFAAGEAERAYLASLADDDRPELPGISKSIGPAIAEGSVSISRPMVVSDEQWYASEFYRRHVEPAGMDEFVASFRLAPQLGSIVMVGGNRLPGAEPIPMRLVQLMGIMGEELAPLLGTRLSLEGQVSKQGLTPRQRQTLDLLLDGLSEKQVARELGLSQATVHDYVVKLHKHFDVSSRGELLSYFIKRRPKGGAGV